MANFTVDTHLFRELGELLVGRDSTALIELIKNAYDADATEVSVFGEHLDDANEGRIMIIDDGVGMNAAQFEKGFLRVASRLKEMGERKSTFFRRRYTGAKGIGRLAAHKLARKLEINSVPRISDSIPKRKALNAVIDWDKIEQFETLDELANADAISLKTAQVVEGVKSGTTLILSQLRRTWSKAERARFFAEVQSFEPPEFLREPLDSSVVKGATLFKIPVVRDQVEEALSSKFQVNLEGDFASGEDYWVLVAQMANWVLEIRADPSNKQVDFAVTPTNRTLSENRDANEFRKSLPHPSPEQGPYFDARILVREGSSMLSRDQRVWAANASGIRLYMEGFRILPYGEPNDDWLSIDADYTRRPRQLEVLKEFGLSTGIDDPDTGLVRVPSNNFFGAIFLTQERCPDMRLLVNREGFVPGASFDTLVKLIRLGVDFLIRERAAASFERRLKRREARRERETDDSARSRATGNSRRLHEDTDPSAISNRILEATNLMREVSVQLTGTEQSATTTAIRELDEAKALVEDLAAEHTLLYVLASVGTQMTVFVHEITALLGAAEAVELALEELQMDSNISVNQRRKLGRTLSATTELRRGLERQVSYLTDVVTLDARRRRSRQNLRERFEAAVRLVQQQAERRGIFIYNQIPNDLRSPTMFPSELIAIFANLLTNAVKAAGPNGSVQASGATINDQIRICIQNTGAAVNLDEAERWFKPFQSTTSEVNPVLGQGMGLGLTITRNLLERYGASITFVNPSPPFVTAIEVVLPSRRLS